MLNDRASLFEKREVVVDRQSTLYRLHRPADVVAGLPVLLFLHGSGESGSDGLSQTSIGLGPAIAREPERFPLLVVMPQASRGYGWRGFNLTAAFAALDEVESLFKADRKRVYITGISMGGYGTWLALLQQPQRFAAAVPVCGGLDVTTAVRGGVLPVVPANAIHEAAAKRIKKVAQWVFHGDADEVIPVTESRLMVQALEQVEANVRYTEYAGVKHNSWDRAYAEPGLMEWMLAQHR